MEDDNDRSRVMTFGKRARWPALALCLSALVGCIGRISGGSEWALYDLASDPGEDHDLSEENPEKLQELLALWDEYAEASGVILPSRDMSYALETF